MVQPSFVLFSKLILVSLTVYLTSTKSILLKLMLICSAQLKIFPDHFKVFNRQIVFILSSFKTLLSYAEVTAVLLFTWWSVSERMMLKSNELCGIPIVTSKTCDYVPSMQNFRFLFNLKYWIHLYSLSSSRFWRFCSEKKLSSTPSINFSKSKQITSTSFLSLKLLYYSV